MALAATHFYMDDPALTCPSRETTMLNESAIAAMRDAIKAIAADNTEARCRAVQKATEIVTTLYLHIDVKREGEIADGLSKVYSHILGLFLRVNLYNDPRIAVRAIDLLEPLRESWADLDAVISACEWPNAPVTPEIANQVEVA
jgi:flagellar biosynthetic protein FliS